MITIYCQCGAIYHAEEQHVGHKIRCSNSKCGAILLIEQRDSASSPHSMTPGADRKPTSNVHPGPTYPKRSSLNRKYLIITGLIVLVLVAVLTFVLRPSNPKTDDKFVSQSITRPSPEAQAKPPAVRLRIVEPENPNRLPLGSAPFGPGMLAGNSNLTVDNGTDTDAIVKVIRFKNGGQKIRNFYISAGEKFSANKIPPGEYILRVAFGRDWNSNARKFNYRQSFSKTQPFTITENKWVESKEDGYIEHTEASEMSITLHKVPFGNFKSYTISEEEFWR